MTTQKNAPADPQNQVGGLSSLTKSAINIVADAVAVMFAIGLFSLALLGALGLFGGCK